MVKVRVGGDAGQDVAQVGKGFHVVALTGGPRPGRLHIDFPPAGGYL